MSVKELKDRLVTIPPAAITISNNRLGRGAFGSVFVATYRGLPVAVKEFAPSENLKLNYQDSLQAFEWETSRLSTLHHPNLVRYYGISQTAKDDLCIVMELCEQRDLSKRLCILAPHAKSPIKLEERGSKTGEEVREGVEEVKYEGFGASYSSYIDDDDSIEEEVASPKQRVVLLPLPTVWRVALDLAHGLQYLHHGGTVHRDLKSENILFDSNGRAKLADLGVAQVDAFVQTSEAKVVVKDMKDYNYAAPEEFKHGTTATAKSDMYSYGLILCEMLRGTQLGSAARRKKGIEEMIPENCPAELCALVKSCWDLDPTKRPSARNAIQALESCKQLCGVDEIESLFPRLDSEIEVHRASLVQYRPSFVDESITIQQALSAFTQIDNQAAPVFVVMGEGGLGKSLATFVLAESLLGDQRRRRNTPTLGNEQEQGWAQSGWVPIFLRPATTLWNHDGLRTLIVKALTFYGVAFDKVDEFKQYRLLFILDGYDELSGNPLGNLPTALGLGEWPNAKLVVSARPSDAYDPAAIFGLSGLCEVRTLLPFNKAQLLEYLQSNLCWTPNEVQQFHQILALGDGSRLKHPLQNPFVLHLFVQSWSTQKQKALDKLTTNVIYENFIQHWVMTYAPLLPDPVRDKLLGPPENWLNAARDWLCQAALTMADKGTLALGQQDILPVWTRVPQMIMDYAWDAVREREVQIKVKAQLAAAASDVHEKGELETEVGGLVRRTFMDRSQFGTLLLSRAEQFFNNSPLRHRNHNYQFIHKSLWEYATAEGIRRGLSRSTDKALEVMYYGLNAKFMLRDVKVLEFLKATATDEDFKHWQEWIHASKVTQSPATAWVAGCAATALNALQLPLPLDMRGGRIPHADLRNAWLSGSNCEGADFSSVLLGGSNLTKVNFRSALLNNIELGQLPTTTLDKSIVKMCTHPKEPFLLLVLGKGLIASTYIAVYSETTRAIVDTLEGHSEEVTSIAINTDGSLLASGSKDKTVRLWKWTPDNTYTLATVLQNADPITAVCFSSQELLAIGTCDGIIVTHYPTRELRGTIHGHSPRYLCFSPDGASLASGDDKGMLSVWEPSGTLRWKLQGHSKHIRGMAFCPTGETLVSCSEDGTIVFWDMTVNVQRISLNGHRPYATYAVAFSPDGRTMVSASEDYALGFWDPESGTLRTTMQGHLGYVSAVTFSRDGQTVFSGGEDCCLRLWQVDGRVERATLDDKNTYMYATDFSPDGQILVSAGDGKSLQFWNAQSGALLHSVAEAHPNSIFGCEFSPNGENIATASGDMTAAIWNAKTGTRLITLVGHEGSVRAATFNHDCKFLATCSDDGTTRVWTLPSLDSVEPGVEIQSSIVFRHPGEGWDVQWSPDSLSLATACTDGNIRVWNWREESIRQTLQNEHVWAVRFSYDGQLIIAGTNLNVTLWRHDLNQKPKENDHAKGEDPYQGSLEGHKRHVNALALVPNSALLLSGGDDKTVRVWRLDTRVCVCVLSLVAPLYGLAVSTTHVAIGMGPHLQIHTSGSGPSHRQRRMITVTKPAISENNNNNQQEEDLENWTYWIEEDEVWRVNMPSVSLCARQCELQGARGLSEEHRAVFLQLGAFL